MNDVGWLRLAYGGYRPNRYRLKDSPAWEKPIPRSPLTIITPAPEQSLGDHVEPTTRPRHASRVPGSLPSEAGSSRGAKSRQAGSPSQETDPGPAEKRRNGKGLSEGQDAVIEAGPRPADGPDGRHGRVERRPDPGQQ
ncbi:hypothetical protein O1611_g9908 [Lasiodiplodia mahajangana]|uniref:Uncharacterized protein n=1 Tax=Lasiodiplodia mahajangana TaxID=1108764 RepID=A0ACC2J443_9PEZI|nr:hypothetical protein O1611_g9908 [Lasiodiplodia mahajangana]